jgi:hypothetical protein
MISKEKTSVRSSRRAQLRNLIKNVAVKSGLSAKKLLRKGRLANVIKARDNFIRETLFEQGYLGCQVTKFFACHPSNVSAEEELLELGKSDMAGPVCEKVGGTHALGFVA